MTNTGQFWTESFIKQIMKMEAFSIDQCSQDLASLVSNYTKAANRTLIFCFDGSNPSGARINETVKPSEEFLSLLKKLSEDPKNQIFIVSSRQKSVVDEWFGSLNGVFLR